MKRLIYPTSLLALVTLLVAACGGEEQPPTFAPLTTPIIPPDFVTFTDESSLFSISYPSNWEITTNLSQLEVEVKDIIQSMETGISFEAIRFVFNAGQYDVLGNVELYVAISVAPLPSEWSVEEYVEANIEGFKSIETGYEELRRTKTTVGDRQVIIIHSEADFSSVIPGDVERDSLDLMLVDGKVGWGVTCGSGTGRMSAQGLETCEAVVRSFRLLS